VLKSIMNKLNKKKKKGFTLIELIIVIAIIAILAAIALPKFMDVREKSNVKSDISNAKNIHTAVCTLIADGKINAASSTFELATTNTNGNATNTVDKLQSVQKLKSKGNTTKNFWVKIDDNGEVQILAGAANGDLVYPNGVAPFND